MPINNYQSYQEFVRGYHSQSNSSRQQNAIHIFHSIDSYTDRDQLRVADVLAQQKAPVIALGSTGVNAILWSHFDFTLQASGKEFPQPTNVLGSLIRLPTTIKSIYISGNIRSYLFELIHAFAIKKFVYKGLDIAINVVNCEDQILMLSKVFAFFEKRKFVLPEDVQKALKYAIPTKLIPVALAKVTTERNEENSFKQSQYGFNSMEQIETAQFTLGQHSQQPSFYHNSNLSRINSQQKIRSDSYKQLNNHLMQAKIEFSEQSSYTNNMSDIGESKFSSQQSSYQPVPRQLWKIADMNQTIEQIIDSIEVI